MGYYADVVARGGKVDPEAHRRSGLDVFEVCIDPEGEAWYAAPSHFEWVFGRYRRENGFWKEPNDPARPWLDNRWMQLRTDAIDSIPIWADTLLWLCDRTGCVAVWEGRTLGECNRAQVRALRQLKMEGLYKGKVPPMPPEL